MKFFIIFFFLFYSLNCFPNNLGSETGLKIPRYVSIKSNDVNVRVGPSTNYPILIKYIQKNIPVEIIQEHKNWRKIVDYNKNTGWIKKNLLKGDRFAIIKETLNDVSYIYINPKGFKIGEIKKNNIVRVNKCRMSWCYISYEKKHGWIPKKNLWGVYKEETYNSGRFEFIENYYWQIHLFLFEIRLFFNHRLI